MTVWQRFLIIGVFITLSQLSHGANFNTGDEQLNRWLINIDFVTKDKDRIKALEELSSTYDVDANRLLTLYENYEFSPAQFHMLLATYQVTQVDWSDLVSHFVRYHPESYEQLLEKIGVNKNANALLEVKKIIEKSAPKGDPEADYQKKLRRGR